MSHQDLHGKTARTNSVYLVEALQWLLKGISWGVCFRDRCSWNAAWLVRMALLWAWSNEETLRDRFHCAQRLIRHMQGADAKDQTSRQAFLELLSRHTTRLIDSLKAALRKRMSHEFSDDWKQCGFVVFGVDGTPINVARTKSNEDAYAAKKEPAKRNRRKNTGESGPDKRSATPQMLLTSLFHVGLQLTWDWRIGSRGDSERTHLLEMLDDLPKGCLITGDAGFVGYELASAILKSGRQMVIRVGSNVRLLKKLGVFRESQATVYLWPDKTAKRAGLLPLVFRTVIMQGPKHPVTLLSSVTDTDRLSDRDVVTIYRRRWSIEVYHRHLKQTFGKRKMLSHKAENARVELIWSVAGLWCISLYATREFVAHDLPIHRLSMAGALRSFREIARDYLHAADSRSTLRIRLRGSLIDDYERKNKSARSYSRRKKHKPAGKPEIKTATKKERTAARKTLAKKLP